MVTAFPSCWFLPIHLFSARATVAGVAPKRETKSNRVGLEAWCDDANEEEWATDESNVVVGDPHVAAFWRSERSLSLCAFGPYSHIIFYTRGGMTTEATAGRGIDKFPRGAAALEILDGSDVTFFEWRTAKGEGAENAWEWKKMVCLCKSWGMFREVLGRKFLKNFNFENFGVRELFNFIASYFYVHF